MKKKLTYGFKRGNLWWSSRKNEFTTLAYASFYTETEANKLSEYMKIKYRAQIEIVRESELADAIEIAAELRKQR